MSACRSTRRSHSQGWFSIVSAPVFLRYSPPPPELGDRISSLYELRQDVEQFNELDKADRPQLRIMLSGDGEYRFTTGRVDQAWDITLLGPTSGPIVCVGHGPMHVVGVGLLPPAWVSIMGTRADRCTDCAIDARELFGERADTLRRSVAAAPDTESRFRLLCEFALEVTRITDPQQLSFTQMVDNWLASYVDPRIETLVEQSGLSMRQLERMAKRYYGLPPKTLARKYRALRAAAALARGEDLDEAGLSDSFYDQSHLIREVKRFAGLTPRQLRGSEARMIGKVARGRKGLSGKVGPLVSDS